MLDVVPLLEATIRDDVGAAVVLALEPVVDAEVVAGMLKAGTVVAEGAGDEAGVEVLVDNEKLGTELAVAEEAGVAVTPNPVKELAGVEDPAVTADAAEVAAADEKPAANEGNVVEEDTEAELLTADGVDAPVVVVTVENDGAADGTKEKDVGFAEDAVEGGADGAKLKEDCEDEEDGANEKGEVVVDVAEGVKDGELELVGLAKEKPVGAAKGDDVAAELEGNMFENEGVVAEADAEAAENAAVVEAAAAVAAAGAKKLGLAEVAVVPNRGGAVDRLVPNTGAPELAAEAVPPNEDAPEAAAAAEGGVPNRDGAAVVVEVDDDVGAAPNSGELAPEAAPNGGAPEVAAPNNDEPELAPEDGAGVPNGEEAEVPDGPNDSEGELDPNGEALAAG